MGSPFKVPLTDPGREFQRHILAIYPFAVILEVVKDIEDRCENKVNQFSTTFWRSQGRRVKLDIFIQNLVEKVAVFFQ